MEVEYCAYEIYQREKERMDRQTKDSLRLPSYPRNLDHLHLNMGGRFPSEPSSNELVANVFRLISRDIPIRQGLGKTEYDE